MKRKLSYLVLIIISMFIYSGEVGASTATCEYQDGNYTISVYYDFYVENCKFGVKKNGSTVGNVKVNVKNTDINIDGNVICPKLAKKEERDYGTGYTPTITYVYTADPNGSISGTRKDFNDDGAEKNGGNTNRKSCTYQEGTKNEFKLEYGSNGLVIELIGSAIKDYETGYSGSFSESDFIGKCPSVSISCPTVTKKCTVTKNGNSDDKKPEKEITDDETLKIVKRIYNLIKILIPVLIIVLSTADFLKVVLMDDEKSYKNAWDKFIKRLIIGVIFFLVPVLVSFILKYSGLNVEQTALEIFK